MGCACSRPDVRDDPLTSPKKIRSSWPGSVRSSQTLQVFQHAATSLVQASVRSSQTLQVSQYATTSATAESVVEHGTTEKKNKVYVHHNSQHEHEQAKVLQPQVAIQEQAKELQGPLAVEDQAKEIQGGTAIKQPQQQLEQSGVEEIPSGLPEPAGKQQEQLIPRRRHSKGYVYGENMRLGNLPRHHEGEQIAAGWPAWLTDAAAEAIRGWIPRRADSFEKLDKIGQGTYSNVYKARDLDSQKIVALKKVRFDNLERESVQFMAREILVLRRLNHPNVIKLQGLVTSRMSTSLYLVFEYMEHDLTGLSANPGNVFTEPQVKCYLHQLLSGLEHCHSNHVLHRDIKGSNLLLDNRGLLKIADFGLATFFNPHLKQSLTSRVVTLWYRPPELLLGATEYDIGVDLWSVGCILGELLAGRPIMPGRTEVEQLHKIFKLCGSPTENFWKKSKLPHATIFKPQQPYKRCIAETYKHFPASAIALLEKLLSIEPTDRGTASSALKSEFFTTKPYACDPSSLPQFPPSKEMDAKLREEERRRERSLADKTSHGDIPKRFSNRDHASRAIPAPQANAELEVNIQRRRYQSLQNHNVKSKSEKFPPAHKDGSLGFVAPPYRLKDAQIPPENQSKTFVEATRHVVPSAQSSCSGPMGPPIGGARRKKLNAADDVRMAPARPIPRGSKPMLVSQSGDLSHLPRMFADKYVRASYTERPSHRQRETEDVSSAGKHANSVKNKRPGQLEPAGFSMSLGRSSGKVKDGRVPLRLSSIAN